MLSGKTIIADSSPLIGLAGIGQLELLRQLARQIVIPRAVLAEVTEARENAPGAEAVAALDWLVLRDADPQLVTPLLATLGRGEAEAIVLAGSNPNSVLLLDDLRARKAAARLDLQRIGTIGFLGEAKHAGLIPAIKPHIDELLANGIHIRKEIILAALRAAGEA